MKVKLLIDKQYKEMECHICSDRNDAAINEALRLARSVFDTSLVAYAGDETVMVPVSDIIRIYGANKQVYVTTQTGEYRIKERLYELEEKLDDKCFVRISNSEIINVKKLVRMDTSMTGTIRMFLEGDIDTYVSRRYVTKIKKALGI